MASPYIQQPKFRILVDFSFSGSDSHSPLCPTFVLPFTKKVFTGELPFPRSNKLDQNYCPIQLLRRGRLAENLEQIADAAKLEAQKGATWNEANAVLVPFVHSLGHSDINGLTRCKCETMTWDKSLQSLFP
jgi:hypothetical protein